MSFGGAEVTVRTRHFAFVTAASVGLAAAVGVWAWVFPDGVHRTFRAEPHVQVCLTGCLVCAVGVYLAVVGPVLLHAAGGRGAVAVLSAASVVYGATSLLLLFGLLRHAQEPGRGPGQVLDFMATVSWAVAFLLLYLLVAGWLGAWVWFRRRPA